MKLFSVNHLRIIFFSLIVFAVGVRLYLIFNLPIWHDEAFSIWASRQAFIDIVTGQIDPVHPPGFYVFLKLWSTISMHLVWLRSSSLFIHCLNMWLFWHIGIKLHRRYAAFLVLLYTFSGYFVIFDWQVRMYTGVVTLILLSLLFFTGQSKYKYGWFTLVNVIGLYVDYSFFWYFGPLLLYVIYKTTIIKDVSAKFWLLSLLISCGGFLFLYPRVLENFSRGLAGIEWTKRYTNARFFLPYFTGTHGNELTTIVILNLFLVGFIIWRLKRPLLQVLPVTLFAATVSLVTTLIVSKWYKPIFHVRSLQIVGLGFLFLISFTFYWIFNSRFRWLILPILYLVAVNFVLVVWGIYHNGSSYLLDFFPWRDVRRILDQKTKQRVIVKPTPKLQTPILLWGLEYTLDGYESWPMKKIDYQKIQAVTKISPNCQLISDGQIQIYSCK